MKNIENDDTIVEYFSHAKLHWLLDNTKEDTVVSAERYAKIKARRDANMAARLLKNEEAWQPGSVIIPKISISRDALQVLSGEEIVALLDSVD